MNFQISNGNCDSLKGHGALTGNQLKVQRKSKNNLLFLNALATHQNHIGKIESITKKAE